MAKPKFDFKDEENLIRIESWARDGLNDKQIAEKILEKSGRKSESVKKKMLKNSSL